MVAVGDHVRPTSAAIQSGVYRVVGAGDPVALLRVADGDDQRVHAGDLRRVDAETVDSEFEPAADPDAGFTPRRSARNLLQGFYWEFRRFV